MSSHMETSFLNSCIKVPIDPCNNCPAPVYNRQKIFLNRSSTSESKLRTVNKTPDFSLDLDTICATNGMRSLANFYDSIPDYCEINHLSENEFYSTLETLKITYSHLKSKPSVPILRNEGRISSTPETPIPCKAKFISSKRKKKRTVRRNISDKKEQKTISASQYEPLCEDMQFFDYIRNDIGVEGLHKEHSNPIRKDSTSLCKSLSMHHLLRENVQTPLSESDKKKTPTEPMSSASCSREFLRKSFSFNDLNSQRPKKEADSNKWRFPETSREDVPNITIQPPSPPNLGDNKLESPKGSNHESLTSTGKKKLKKTKSASTRVPFSFLGINECTISENNKVSSSSPLHPVARPNLAATLRLEVSKKKVKEMQNNCIFQDNTPHIDWEVRKTPAWKSLYHNESHKAILAQRLATRKAEQELQKCEYEKHMEIMRHRVKSAPLLLEGSTFWGPHVGKLSHSCHKNNNLKHNCQHGNHLLKKKKVNKPFTSKYIPNRSHSRASNNSTNLQESDELSSLDRAYL